MKNIMAQNFYTHILASALGRMHSHCLSSRYYYRHVLSAADATVGLSQVSDADFDRLMNYDDKCFVRPGSKWRREFISRWIKIPGGRSVMAVNHRGDVIGYGCRNPGVFRSKLHFVGPLYADSYAVAWDLIHELTRDIVGEAISIFIM